MTNETVIKQYIYIYKWGNNYALGRKTSQERQKKTCLDSDSMGGICRDHQRQVYFIYLKIKEIYQLPAYTSTNSHFQIFYWFTTIWFFYIFNCLKYFIYSFVFNNSIQFPHPCDSYKKQFQQ